MPNPPETRYTPVLDPRDARSLPGRLRRGGRVVVPFQPDRRGRCRGRKWLRRLADELPLWGHYCLPDPTLRRLETMDPLGLRLAADAGVEGILTMDVPVYSFMDAVQRERAYSLHLHRLVRTIESAERAGLGVLPMVKALDADGMGSQLDLLAGLGVRGAALYARELLLEHDPLLLRRFVRGCHRRRLEPFLLGAFSRRWLQWGPAELASLHHYVLARRSAILDPRGRPQTLDTARYDTQQRRFLFPRDLAGLCTYNYGAARAFIEAPTLRLGQGG